MQRIKDLLLYFSTAKSSKVMKNTEYNSFDAIYKIYSGAFAVSLFFQYK